MKIESVQLINFRNFYGTHDIKLSVSDEKPVTVFIGENGAGKTTLLNAIFWAFTGGFSSVFENPHLLVNKDAAEVGEKKCSVLIKFSDGNDKYYLTRAHHDGHNKSSLSITRLDQNGESNIINSDLTSTYLNKFIPEKLANWFIFDGEAVGKIKLDGSHNFKEDIRSTFGFTEIVDLITRLDEKIIELTKEQSKLLNNKELNTIIEQIDEYQEILEDSNIRIKKIEENIVIWDKEVRNANSELGGIEQSKPLQSQIDIAEYKLKELREAKKKKEKEQKEYLIKNYPSVLLYKKIKNAEKHIVIKESKQALPHPFGTRLIDDIITMKKCICGTAIFSGSKEEKHLIDIKGQGSTSLFDQRLSKIRGAFSHLEIVSRTFDIQMESYIDDIGNYERGINDQIDVIRISNEKLKGIPQNKINELLSNRDQATAKIADANIEKGSKLNQLNDARKKITELNNRRDIILTLQNKNTALQIERADYEQLKNFVSEQFVRQEQEVLNVLGKEISEVLNQYLTKHYSAKINSDTYKITTYDIDGRDVPLSTGENQVLKFAVIAAIVGMAGSKTKTIVDWISEPIVAPLIFDAPFSVNDAGYRSGIAKNLAELASQLVFLFDSDKWNSELSNLLSGKLGKFYIIVSRAKGAKKPENKSIFYNGKSYSLNEYDAERDESICKELL